MNIKQISDTKLVRTVNKIYKKYRKLTRIHYMTEAVIRLEGLKKQ